MSRLALDLAGRSYGHLTAQERVILDRPTPHAYWRCLCSCGNLHVARASHLTSGQITQCSSCARDRVSATAAREQPVTVVQVWCSGAGELGAFARAVDEQGQVMARSHFSRLPQKLSGPPHNVKVVRLCVATLESLGVIRARSTHESIRHWWRACRVSHEMHLFTPSRQLQEVWFETSHAPGPDSIILKS